MVELVKEEPPPDTGKGIGRGRGSAVAFAEWLKTLANAPGTWFVVPREYTGYPTERKRKFEAEGIETTVSTLRSDTGKAIGYKLYVRYPEGEPEPEVYGDNPGITAPAAPASAPGLLGQS